jgi:hypothetical protein
MPVLTRTQASRIGVVRVAALANTGARDEPASDASSTRSRGALQLESGGDLVAGGDRYGRCPRLRVIAEGILMLSRETATFTDSDGWNWEFNLAFMLSNYGWCTEQEEAFSGERPVYLSMEAELRRLCGDDVYKELAAYCQDRQRARRPPRLALLPIAP